MKRIAFPLKDILLGCNGSGQFFIAMGTFKARHRSYESVSFYHLNFIGEEVY